MDDMERYEIDGMIIIVPKNDKKVPLDCPVCGLAFSTRDDVLSYKTFGCCEDCNLTYRDAVSWDIGTCE